MSSKTLVPHPGCTLGSFLMLLKNTSAWVTPPEMPMQSVAGLGH